MQNVTKKRLVKFGFLLGMVVLVCSGCTCTETLIVRDYPVNRIAVMAVPSTHEEQQKAQAVTLLNQYFNLTLDAVDWNFSYQLIAESPYWNVEETRQMDTLVFLLDKNTQEMEYGLCFNEETLEVLAAQSSFDVGSPLAGDAETQLKIRRYAAAWFKQQRPDFDSGSLSRISIQPLENDMGLAILRDNTGKTKYLYMKLTDGQPLAFGTGFSAISEIQRNLYVH